MRGGSKVPPYLVLVWLKLISFVYSRVCTNTDTYFQLNVLGSWACAGMVSSGRRQVEAGRSVSHSERGEIVSSPFVFDLEVF